MVSVPGRVPLLWATSRETKLEAVLGVEPGSPLLQSGTLPEPTAVP